MSLINMVFESQYLNGNTNISIILPDHNPSISPRSFYESGKKYKVLWLLHGSWGDNSDWVRKSNIEVYAIERNLIVVMMSALNTNYENWDNFCMGHDEMNYITEELMPMIHNWLPASDKREDNYIAGLSMGGNGALRIALSHPEYFAGAASLSAVPEDLDEQTAALEEIWTADRRTLDVLTKRRYNDMHRFDSLSEYLNSSDNLWRKLAECAENHADLPRLFYSIGYDDHFYYTNGKYEHFKNFAENSGLDIFFTEGTGKHEWRVWDRDIQKVLDYFNL